MTGGEAGSLCAAFRGNEPSPGTTMGVDGPSLGTTTGVGGHSAAMTGGGAYHHAATPAAGGGTGTPCAA
jgi:hypothetical protein